MIRQRFRLGTGVQWGRRTRGASAPASALEPSARRYTVLAADGSPCSRARTGDLLAAHRWLHAAADGASLGVSRLGAPARWRPLPAALYLPRPLQHGERAAAAWVCAEGLPSRRVGRLRAAALLLRRGLDGAATASLLRHHEGHFPGLGVAVARTLLARIGGLYLLRRLDLRAVTADLIAGAAIWVLPDTGGGRWPEGVHLFLHRPALTEGPQPAQRPGSKPTAADRPGLPSRR